MLNGQHNPVASFVYVVLAASALAWTVMVVADYSIFADLINHTNAEVMVATLLGGVAVFDIGETAGIVEYPRV